MEKIPSFSESTVEKIGRLLDDVLERVDILEFQEKMIAFTAKIRKRHPDYDRYRCYHKLIGSTLPENDSNIIEDDFKGEDSVVAFLENLLKKELV